MSRDGQVGVWWETTPLYRFFTTTAFHEEAAARVRHETFAGADLPMLACRDLAVFKAFFNGTQDWAELERMNDAGSLDVEAVLGVIVRHLGGEDSGWSGSDALP